MGELKDKTLKGFAWSTIHSFANTGIQFLFMLFMTRLLLPSDYGMVGMLAVFMSVANAFIDCGFGQALIRKQNRTSIDESTVFYFNIVASTLCYIILFLIAPFISSFYNMLELIPVMRVMGLTLIISSLGSLHSYIYRINLDFKTLAIIGLSCSILAGGVGVYLASRGYGVWALVWQQVLSSILSTLAYWSFSKWRPIWSFSFDSFKEMFAFGSKLLGTRLLNVFYANISPIFIGKYYSAADLGLYSKGHSIASIPCNTAIGILSSVSYPALCKLQSDEERLAYIYRKFVRSSSFVIFPVMVLLAVLATPLMIFLFGEKWAGSGIYLSLCCFSWMLVPAQVLNFNLLNVIGRSDLGLKLEIVTKIIGVVMLSITLPISVLAMCYGTIVNTMVCLTLNIFVISRCVRMSVATQFVDIMKSLFLSLSAGALAYIVAMYFDDNLLKIVLGGLAGFIFYIGCSIVFQVKELGDIFDVLKRR